MDRYFCYSKAEILDLFFEAYDGRPHCPALETTLYIISVKNLDICT